MVAAATPTHYARWLHQADDYPLQSIPTGMAFPSHEVFLILFFLSPLCLFSSFGWAILSPYAFFVRVLKVNSCSSFVGNGQVERHLFLFSFPLIPNIFIISFSFFFFLFLGSPMKSSKSNKWRRFAPAKTVEASGALRQVFHPRRYYPFLFLLCVSKRSEWKDKERKKKPSCTSQVVVVVVVCSGANRYLHVLTFTVGGARWADGTNVKECADPAATCLSARCHSSRALANLMLHLFLFMCVMMYAFCDWPSFLNQ